MSNTSTRRTVDQTKAAKVAGKDSESATVRAVELFKQYSQERPEVVVLWAFGIGFCLGWKLKPW